MKLSTAVIIAKGLCYVLIGAFTPWAAALAQWAGSGEWPARIIWVGVILPASILGGAGQLLAFLSNSFGNFQKERNGQLPVVAIPAEPNAAPPVVKP